MSIDAIDRLEKSSLFGLLLKLEHSDHSLSEAVKSIVKQVSPLLARIPEKMTEYTLHDSTHSAKVVELMGKIIPPETLDHLNAIEVSLLILAAYLHDIGMTCSTAEREEIIKNSDEYKIMFKSDKVRFQEFEDYKNKGEHRFYTFIEDQVFTEFLRRNHVKRSAEYISTNFNEVLLWQDIPFTKWLIKICDGHGEPVKKFRDQEFWPRDALIGEKRINVQYLSLILRLADILDLDPERTPKVIYQFVNPQNPISIIEWQKHRSIKGWDIRHDIVVFEAECKRPEVERALREFINIIENERRETLHVLSEYQDEISKHYILKLEQPITNDKIYSDNSYIHCELKFEIDYTRILQLLMGKNLYKNPAVAVRELIQNSIDAISIRQDIYKNRIERFDPEIAVSLSGNVLSIEDNGVGMDKEIFENFFLQVGKSYYGSQIFYEKYPELDSISEFGIGILSSFMIANSLTVESWKEPDEPLEPPEPIYFEIPTAFSYLVQRKSNRHNIGTLIRLELKNDHPFKEGALRDFIMQIVPNPRYPIKIKSENENYIHSGMKLDEIYEISPYQLMQSDIELAARVSFDRLSSELWTKKLFEFKLSEEDDELQNIKGTLEIINSDPRNFFGNLSGYITQRSIGIGHPTVDNNNSFSIKPSYILWQLFPGWTNVRTAIDFTENACLKITPDRNDIIADEKYERLKKKIEIKVIKEFRNYFKEINTKKGILFFYQFVDFLLAYGFIGLTLNKDLRLTNTSIDFFLEIISFAILDDGKIVRKSAKELMKYKTLGVILDDWSNEYTDTISNYVTTNGFPVIILNDGNIDLQFSKEKFIVAFYGNKRKRLDAQTLLISPEPDIVIQLVKYDNKPCQLAGFDETLSFVEVIKDKLYSDKHLLLTLKNNNELVPTFNRSHRLFEPLFTGNSFKNEKVKKIVHQLRFAIRDTLRDIIRTWSNSDDPEWLKTLNARNFNFIVVGIFKREPRLLSMLSNHFEEFWNSAKKLNLVESEAKLIRITKEDFPWHWDTEIK